MKKNNNEWIDKIPSAEDTTGMSNIIEISSNILIDINNIIDSNIITQNITYNNIIIPNNQIITASDFIHTTEHIEEAYEIAKLKKEIIEDEIQSLSNSDDTKVIKNRIFLKACDICFNGNSYYSNNVILYRLNYNKVNDIKPPITGFKYIENAVETPVQTSIQCDQSTKEDQCPKKYCEWKNDKCNTKKSEHVVLKKAEYKEYDEDNKRGEQKVRK